MGSDRYYKILLSFLIFSFVALSFSACKSDANKTDDTLAVIDGLEVTEAHFKSAFKKYYYQTGQSLSPSFETKSSILDTEFNTYVLATYAKKTGIADSEQSRKKLGLIQRKVIAEEYLEREVLNRTQVTDKEVRELFSRFNTTLRASHLYAPDKETAYQLYHRLEQGEDFETLAEEVFDNPYLAKNGGDIGGFSIDEMDIAFENAAFKLNVGEISEPVKTKQGYSIIKLTDFYQTPIVTEFQYASLKNRFESFAIKRKKELETRAHLQQVIQSLNIDDKIIELLWDEVAKNQNGALSLTEDQQLKLSTSLGDDQVIGGNGLFTFTIGDLKSEGYYTPEANINRIDRFHRFRDFVKGLAYRSFVIEEFQNKYDIEAKDIKGSINQTFYDYLAGEVENSLKQQMQLSDEELRREFLQNKPYYDFPMRINLGRIVVESKEKGLEVVSKLKNGLTWEEAIRNYTIENKDLLVNGELGFQPIQELGSHAYHVKDLEKGEIAGPFEYQTGKLMVYKVIDIQEPREADFNEVKGLVENVLKQKKAVELRNELIEKTKAEYDAVLNYEKLKTLTVNL